MEDDMIEPLEMEETNPDDQDTTPYPVDVEVEVHSPDIAETATERQRPARRRLPLSPDVDTGLEIQKMQQEMAAAVTAITGALETHRDATEAQIRGFHDYLQKTSKDQQQREATSDRRYQELLRRLQPSPLEKTPKFRRMPETPSKPQTAFRPIERSSPTPTIEVRRPEPAARMPMGRLDTYDGTTPWLEYQTYFEEYSDFCGWSDPEKARYLCLQLRGGAQSVLVGLEQSERRDYDQVVHALRQHFCPAEKVYTYQAELQARRLQPDESLTDLAREIQCKARLAYPEAGLVTLESLMRSHFRTQ